MINRRRFLHLGAAAATTATSLLATRAAHAAVVSHQVPRSLELYNLHTGESVKTVYWANGKYVGHSLSQINHLMRDYRTDQTHIINPAVLDLLHALQARLGTRQPFQIVSGYRSPQTNAMLASSTDGVAAHSLHMAGKAVDIRIPGVSVAHLTKAALSLRAGGVGSYPQSDFVHVDVGPLRRW